MRTLILALFAALLLTGWGSCERRPNVPEQVTVVVEKFKPLPDWATAPLPKPERADGTIGALSRSHEARGSTIDVANCHRALLRRLDAGEPVDKRACEGPR